MTDFNKVVLFLNLKYIEN